MNDLTQTRPGALQPNGVAAQQLTLTPSVGSLAKALADARDRCKAAAKSSTNNFHKYRYAGADEIIGTASEALAGSGLGLIPLTQELTVLGSGSAAIYALNRTLLLAHSSGETVPLEIRGWPIVPERGRPLDKAYAIGLTSSLSYVLRDLLQMPRIDPSDDIAAQRDTPATPASPHPGDAQAPAPPPKAAADPTPPAPAAQDQPETITPNEAAVLTQTARQAKRTVSEVQAILAVIGVKVLQKAPRAQLGWLTQALQEGLATEQQRDSLTAHLKRLGTDFSRVPQRLSEKFGVTSLAHLLKSQAALLESQLAQAQAPQAQQLQPAS